MKRCTSTGTGSTTIAEALARAKALGLELLDAQVLLSHCLACSRSHLIAHAEVKLAESDQERFDLYASRRARGEPLAYLIGEKEFHGLTLQVSPSVLIPRPETEHLVDWGIEILQAFQGCGVQPRVVDLGTGSGAIGLAIKHAFPAVCVEAVDISAEALRMANANGTRLGLEVSFYASEWWAATAAHTYHLALCNPPYLAGNDPHLNALFAEPLSALTTGGQGHESASDVIRGAPAHLQPGGWLLMEHGFDQADFIRQLFHEQGFVQIQTRVDLAGRERCTGARIPGGSAGRSDRAAPLSR